MSHSKDTYHILLFRFLGFLKREGFHITPEDYAQISMIIAQISPESVAFKDIKFYVAPIVAKDENQQEIFYHLFETFFSLTSDSEKDLVKGGGDSDETPLPPSQLPQAPLGIGYKTYLLVISTISIFISISLTFFTQWSSDAFFWLVVLWLSVGLPYLVLSLLYFWKKQQSYIPKRTEQQIPPYIFFLRTPNVPHLLLRDDEIRRLHRVFRRLKSEEYSRFVNIENTIQATIRKAGIVQPVFQHEDKDVEFVVIIEKQRLENHVMHWMEYIFSQFEQLSASVHVFYYETDPRICMNKKGELVNIQNFKGINSHLIVVGNGHCFVDTYTFRFEHSISPLYKWAETWLKGWAKVGILTPVHLDQWQTSDHTLSELFCLSRASLDGLISLLDYWQDDNLIDKARLSEPLCTTGPTHIDLLEVIYPPQVFDWICACAIYPEIQWDLTIHLGLTMETRPHELVNGKNIELLLRLPWFKSGRMPKVVRYSLIERLDSNRLLLIKVRQIVAELLSNQNMDKENGNMRARRLYNEAIAAGDDEKKRREKCEELYQWCEAGHTDDVDIEEIFPLKKQSFSSFFRNFIRHFFSWRGLTDSLIEAASEKLWIRIEDLPSPVSPLKPPQEAEPMESEKYPVMELCTELKEKNTNYIFLFGEVAAGKTAVISSLIYHLDTNAKEGALYPVDHSFRKAEFHNHIRNKFSKGVFLDRSKIDILDVGFSFKQASRSDIRLTFLEMSGENFSEIERGPSRVYRDEVEKYLRCPGINVIFFLVVDWNTAKKQDLYISNFLEYIETESPKEDRKQSFLLLLSKWETYKGRYKEDVAEFVKENMPHAFSKLSYVKATITSYSVGTVWKEELTSINKYYPEKVKEWLFSEIAPRSTSNPFWKTVRDIFSKAFGRYD